MDRFAQYAMVASDEANIDSARSRQSINYELELFGEQVEAWKHFRKKLLSCRRWYRDLTVLLSKMIADVTGNILLKYGFMGPNYTQILRVTPLPMQ
jgi:3-oxoacyl-[acyl-carrier-protein] synthase II